MTPICYPRYIRDERRFLLPTKEACYNIMVPVISKESYDEWMKNYANRLIKEKQFECQLALSGCIILRSEKFYYKRWFDKFDTERQSLTSLDGVENPWEYYHCEKFWGYEFIDVADEEQVRKVIKAILFDKGQLEDIWELLMQHSQGQYL